jgi:hypothetical protein
MRLRLALVLAVATSAPAVAQQRSCKLVESGSGTQIGSEEGNQLFFLGGGVNFRCTDGVTILSDSLAWYQAAGIAEFVGHVRYADAENRLTAGYVRYLGRERKAIAQIDVVLTDRETGSTILAPHMDYYQRSEQRPEPLIQMFSGRPHAILVSLPGSDTARADTIGADSARADTTVVDADAMEINGRNRFNARGNVELQRGELRGWSQFADMDRGAGSLRLITSARLESPDYRLAGDTIVGRTNDADELEEVTAIRAARLDASDVAVAARSIRVFLDEGEVSRLVARGEVPDTGAVDPRRQASAVSADFQLTADSIDVLAPGRQLDTLTAVGRAWGQRLGDDLADANIPAIVAHDWMRGDTIIATFREAAPAPDDTTGEPSREIDTVTSIGRPAASAYRVADEEDSTGTPAINYVRALRIVVSMVAGKVATVNADGDVQGIYLQPVRRSDAGDRGSGGRGPR